MTDTCKMASCEDQNNTSMEEPAMSMVDVLEEQTALEEDANAVLGAADAHNCTYDMGYIKRQALYACGSCSEAGQEPAGVCLACSLECHEGHHLYELYTKRNFRCDCGNGKFPGFQCKLRPGKKDSNDDNSYNQNFRGVYCTCHRPYPDPQHETDDEMIQCIVCEDWYHTGHLSSPVPEFDYDDMICDACMVKCEFLRAYAPHTDSEDSLVVVDDEATKCKTDSGPPRTSGKEPSPTDTALLDAGNLTADPSTSDKESCGSDQKGASTGENICSKDIKPEIEPDKKNADGESKTDAMVIKDYCPVEQWKLSNPKTEQTKNGATFWKKGWRLKLCGCKNCQAMYSRLKVEYLTDTEDTISSYEAGSKPGPNQYEKGMAALSSMDRTMQVEVLHGFNDMKTELKDYLKKFAENGKVVREEDIKEFFSQISSRKKRRVAGGVQYFCK